MHKYTSGHAFSYYMYSCTFCTHLHFHNFSHICVSHALSCSLIDTHTQSGIFLRFAHLSHHIFPRLISSPSCAYPPCILLTVPFPHSRSWHVQIPHIQMNVPRCIPNNIHLIFFTVHSSVIYATKGP